MSAVEAALIKCARALAFSFGGSERPAADEPEQQALWDAMHAAYSALGVTDTREYRVTHGLDLLTADEREALRLTAQLANLCHRIIGRGPQAEPDWAEMAHRIHAVQHMVMAQAAARAYPSEFRALGETIPASPAPGPT